MTIYFYANRVNQVTTPGMTDQFAFSKRPERLLHSVNCRCHVTKAKDRIGSKAAVEGAPKAVVDRFKAQMAGL